MLQVINLHSGYEKGFQLRNINLAILQGEVLGIIGPNGAGKTTLLRSLTLALKPESGSVLLNQENIAGMTPRAFARKVAVVSQTIPSVDMTVEEFVLLGRIPHHRPLQFMNSEADRQVADRALSITDTTPFKYRVMNNLSGGERQLVLIARALAQQPDLLLLDEPTAHLDIGHQILVLDLLRRLNREWRLTLAMVLHDLNIAAEYCHRLALMHNGTLRMIGTPDQVLDYPLIEEVYRTVVVVNKNPITGKPCVLPVPEIHRTVPA